MKKLVLALTVMAGFSSIYPIGHSDKMKCLQVTHDIANLTAQIPADINELPAFIEAKKASIRLCVRNMRQLIHRYPHDHVIQGLAHTCAGMEEVLRVIESLESN